MSEDLIKRSDAIEALGEEPYVWTDDDEFAQGERSQWIDDVSAIKAVPSADRPQGEWIIHFDDLFPEDSSIECPVCHEEQPMGIDDNYCPNCGCRMKGADDE